MRKISATILLVLTACNMEVTRDPSMSVSKHTEEAIPLTVVDPDPIPTVSVTPTPSPSPEPSPEPIPEPSPSPSPSPTPLSLDGIYMYRESKCGSNTVFSAYTDPGLMYNYREVSGTEVKIKTPAKTNGGVSCGIRIARVNTLSTKDGYWEETIQYNQSYPSDCSAPHVEYVSGVVDKWNYERTPTQLILISFENCDSSGNKLRIAYDQQ